MTDPRFGLNTQIKLLGGVLHVRILGRQPAQWIEKIEGMKGRAANLAPLFATFRPSLQALAKAAFDDQGPGWARLSPAYAAWKATRYPGKTILRRTDRLYNSLVGATSDSVWAATPRTIRFGTRVGYYEWHQTGTRSMPARPVVVMRRSVSREMARRAGRYVRTGDILPGPLV